MKKFGVYNGHDLQIAVSVLEQLKGQKVDEVLLYLHQEINRRFPDKKLLLKKTKLKQKQCPSCKRGVLYGPYKVSGLKVLRCSKKCGYSEVVA